MRTMSFCPNCTPATNPSMLSLKINISTAAKAPNPVIRVTGDLSRIIENIIMMAKKRNIPCTICTIPFMGRLRN